MDLHENGFDLDISLLALCEYSVEFTIIRHNLKWISRPLLLAFGLKIPTHIPNIWIA